MRYLLAVALFVCSGTFALAPWAGAYQTKEYYAVSLKEIVGKPTLNKKNGYIITVKIDKMIPYDTGRVVFDDGKALDMETIDATKDQPKSTDQIIIYFRGNELPLNMKTPDDLRAKLPLEAKIYLRRNRPAD